MRPLITLNSLGWCYLLHFSKPLGNPTNARAQAQHYSGWFEDLEIRVAQHLAGEGAKITRAAVAQGIEISLVATWRAPLSFEKYLKRRKDAPRLCPICCRKQHRRVRQIAVPDLEQLTLGLDDQVEEWPAGFEFPPAPSTKMGGYEFFKLQKWAAARVPLPIDVPDELI
jgi:predicted GIY-YIG superfamily endonuclease